MDESAISIRGLRKQYPGTDRPAVDGVDLEVRHGGVVALLGPNGAGKTSTVEILEGYRDRDAGEVTVLGADPGRAGPAWRARIGIVPQHATDLAELRPHEVVHHLASYYPDPRDPDEVLVGIPGPVGPASDQRGGEGAVVAVPTRPSAR